MFSMNSRAALCEDEHCPNACFRPFIEGSDLVRDLFRIGLKLAQRGQRLWSDKSVNIAFIVTARA
jgi:hypothetical protein